MDESTSTVGLDCLRKENRVLREQLGNRRLRLNDDQRRRLAAKARGLARKVLADVAAIATPETLLAWHRKLIAEKYDGSSNRAQGRPRTAGKIEAFRCRRCGQIGEATENDVTVRAMILLLGRFWNRGSRGGEGARQALGRTPKTERLRRSYNATSLLPTQGLQICGMSPVEGGLSGFHSVVLAFPCRRSNAVCLHPLIERLKFRDCRFQHVPS